MDDASALRRRAAFENEVVVLSLSASRQATKIERRPRRAGPNLLTCLEGLISVSARTVVLLVVNQ